ncbi:MAG: hypothetical protein QG640_45 [Patescibacteria group bacterium]|nr:hypothetical protein [Patescibacteria group bacterium]
MSARTLKIILALLIFLALGGGVYYWYFYFQNPTLDENGEVVSPFEFSPFGRTPVVNQPIVQIPNTPVENPVEQPSVPLKLPKLRQLSSTPVAGMSASTTKTSSLIRFMDRGTGHVYEADDISSDIRKLSNTTLPKIYESYWNKNLTAFVLRYLRDESDTISNFYAELKSTGTSTVDTPYEIKGRYLSPDIGQVAVSPSGEKIFTWNVEGGKGIGYTSSFDEKNKIKVADVPLTQVVVDWPETNTVTIATKAFSKAAGYFYSLDVRTGVLKKIVGGGRGLSGKLSKDGSRLIYSSLVQNSIRTFYLDTKNSSSQEVLFRTLADKCLWGTLRKNELYCAVPSEFPNGTYPDDWYTGKVSFTDQIWHLDTLTGEVHLLANLFDISKQAIDAVDLTLDPKENFLYFINKRDLTLWSLDLNQ